MRGSVVVLAMLVAPAAAWAQDGAPLGADPRRLDVFLGPVQGSSRAVGLSGAFASIAEGVEGLLWNPAAVANRYPYSLDWWDWDLDVGLLFPTNALGQDFDNDGRTATDYAGSTVGLLGGSLSFGYLGLGLEASLQSYTVDVDLATGRRRVDVNLTTFHGDVAFGLLRGQLVIGGGARGVLFGVRETSDRLLAEGDEIEGLEDRSGLGAELGVLVRPDEQPFRFAVVVRTPVVDENADCETPGDPEAAYQLPCEVVLPWEVELGASWMLGPRVYNPRWINPNAEMKRLRRELEQRRAARLEAHRLQLAQVPPEQYAQEAARIQAEEPRTREREDREIVREAKRLEHEREEAFHRAPRRYVLLSADLVVTGDVQDAIGVEALVRQEEQASGEAFSFTPRLGVESEVWHDRLRLRGGGYLEPSRFRDVGPRPHGTFGFDLRLFYTTLFDLLSRFGVRASGVVDVAPRYLQFAVSLGIWH
jgi:hypothetical protein